MIPTRCSFWQIIGWSHKRPTRATRDGLVHFEHLHNASQPVLLQGPLNRCSFFFLSSLLVFLFSVLFFVFFLNFQKWFHKKIHNFKNVPKFEKIFSFLKKFPFLKKYSFSKICPGISKTVGDFDFFFHYFIQSSHFLNNFQNFNFFFFFQNKYGIFKKYSFSFFRYFKNCSRFIKI